MSSFFQPSLLDATTDYTDYGVENERLCQEVKGAKEQARETNQECDVTIQKYTQAKETLKLTQQQMVMMREKNPSILQHVRFKSTLTMPTSMTNHFLEVHLQCNINYFLFR